MLLRVLAYALIAAAWTGFAGLVLLVQSRAGRQAGREDPGEPGEHGLRAAA